MIKLVTGAMLLGAALAADPVPSVAAADSGARVRVVLQDGSTLEGRGPVERGRGVVVFRLLDGRLVSLRSEDVAAIRGDGAAADAADAADAKGRGRQPAAGTTPGRPSRRGPGPEGEFTNADLPAPPPEAPAARVDERTFDLPPSPAGEPDTPEEEVAIGEPAAPPSELPGDLTADPEPTPEELAEGWCLRREVLQADLERLRREREQWSSFRVCAQHGLRPTDPDCTPQLRPLQAGTAPSRSERLYAEREAQAAARVQQLTSEIDALEADRPAGTDDCLQQISSEAGAPG